MGPIVLHRNYSQLQEQSHALMKEDIAQQYLTVEIINIQPAVTYF